MTTIALMIATVLGFAAALVPVSIGLAHDARARHDDLVTIPVDDRRRAPQHHRSERSRSDLRRALCNAGPMARPSTSPPKHATSSSQTFSPPPRAHLVAGWALLPLRVFLGATFLFAGLQKLANPNFFDPNSPSSIQAQLIASARLSPIHLLIGHLLRFATPLGILISLGEIAVGIGMLLGLWTRVAALGGAALAFMLFLTVSFHASPYYTGADIVFFFAFIPFLVAGAGGGPSLDQRIAKRASEELGHGDPTPFVLPFSRVQDLCGSYDKGRCRAQRSALCSSAGCPVLERGLGQRPRAACAPDQVDRRAVVIGAVCCGGGGRGRCGRSPAAAAGIGRAIGGTPKATSATGS